MSLRRPHSREWLSFIVAPFLLSIQSIGHSPQPEGHVTEQETSVSDSESEYDSLPDSTSQRIDLQYVFGPATSLFQQ